jgi:excisionase family DNA binding protein
MSVEDTKIPPAQQLLLTPLEAADALRISPKSLYSLTSPRGPIRAVRIGRSVRYAASTLAKWIADCEGEQ